ncbi:hypothetical protein [Companilactobacillus nodensis]|nr:hypothetical protein [Companilactobacillus nodensis]
MPPHLFLGFSISEWLGIISIISILVGAFKTFLFNPIGDQLKDLSGAIQNLSDNSAKAHSDLEKKISKNHLDIERHDIEIDFLFDKNHLHRREKNEDGED